MNHSTGNIFIHYIVIELPPSLFYDEIELSVCVSWNVIGMTWHNAISRLRSGLKEAWLAMMTIYNDPLTENIQLLSKLPRWEKKVTGYRNVFWVRTFIQPWRGKILLEWRRRLLNPPNCSGKHTAFRHIFGRFVSTYSLDEKRVCTELIKGLICVRVCVYLYHANRSFVVTGYFQKVMKVSYVLNFLSCTLYRQPDS